jgi:hypothetical protein
MWGFHAIRQKAITNLSGSSLDPVDKIILSKRYDVPGWLVPALNQIAQREEHLSIEDARRLSAVAGWEFPIHIGHVRETYGGNASNSIQFKSINWSCSSCTTWYCSDHHLNMKKGKPDSYVTWPCAVCPRYYCENHTRYTNVPHGQSVPTVPRSQYDFMPEIRKTFNIA